jgi:hypothetical protein
MTDRQNRVPDTLLIWEQLAQDTTDKYGLVNRTARARVLGGWLVAVSIGTGGGVTFYPDPELRWDGSSLE